VVVFEQEAASDDEAAEDLEVEKGDDVDLKTSAAALKQLEASEQLSDELVSHFHEEVTRTGRSRKKSRKQQEAERDALFG
jgi:hypothetical protein